MTLFGPYSLLGGGVAVRERPRVEASGTVAVYEDYTATSWELIEPTMSYAFNSEAMTVYRLSSLRELILHFCVGPNSEHMARGPDVRYCHSDSNIRQSVRGLCHEA